MQNTENVFSLTYLDINVDNIRTMIKQHRYWVKNLFVCFTCRERSIQVTSCNWTFLKTSIGLAKKFIQVFHTLSWKTQTNCFANPVYFWKQGSWPSIQASQGPRSATQLSSQRQRWNLGGDLDTDFQAQERVYNSLFSWLAVMLLKGKLRHIKICCFKSLFDQTLIWIGQCQSSEKEMATHSNILA